MYNLGISRTDQHYRFTQQTAPPLNGQAWQPLNFNFKYFKKIYYDYF